MAFTKATKYGAKLRMSLTGPSGAGKTWTALMLATLLVEGNGSIALIDTEHGSACKYAGDFDFDTQNLDAPYTPERYVEMIHEAEEEGYAVIIVDSLSHEWAGPGGVLEIVDELTTQSKNKDSRAAWRVATPRHNKLLYAVNACKAHIICTMRSKTETVTERNEQGRTITREIGLAPIQRENIRYEFDVGADMEANTASIINTRCSKLNERSFHKPGKELADILIEWLTGVDPWEPARLKAKQLNYIPTQWAAITKQYKTPEATMAYLVEQEQRLESAVLSS